MLKLQNKCILCVLVSCFNQERRRILWLKHWTVILEVWIQFQAVLLSPCMIAASCLTFVSPCFVHQMEMVDLGNLLPSSIMGSDGFTVFRVHSLPIKHGILFLFYEWGTEAQIILGWSTLNNMCLPWQISWLPDNPIWGSGWNMLQFPPSPSVSGSLFLSRLGGRLYFTLVWGWGSFQGILIHNLRSASGFIGLNVLWQSLRPRQEICKGRSWNQGGTKPFYTLFSLIYFRV